MVSDLHGTKLVFSSLCCVGTQQDTATTQYLEYGYHVDWYAWFVKA